MYLLASSWIRARCMLVPFHSCYRVTSRAPKRKTLTTARKDAVLAESGYNEREWQLFLDATTEALRQHYPSSSTLPRTWFKTAPSDQKNIATSVRAILRGQRFAADRFPSAAVLGWRFNSLLRSEARSRHTHAIRKAWIASHAPGPQALEVPANMSRFRNILKRRVHALAEQHPQWTWMEMPVRSKRAIVESVNADLEELDVPKVPEQYMLHQMERCLMAWKNRENRRRRAEGEDVEVDVSGEDGGFDETEENQVLAFREDTESTKETQADESGSSHPAKGRPRSKKGEGSKEPP